MSAALILQAVTHRFAFKEVVQGIHLRVQAGECVALVGPSGCGKSTVLNLAAGLLTPWEGQCHNGFACTTMMFQQPRLLPWLRVLDNIALGLKARGMPRTQRLQAAAALAQDMGLQTTDLDKFPAELSGGMQSRVALARALAPQPDLLLLDEPLSALDVGLKAEMYRLLMAQQQARHCAVLLITHDLMEAVQLADRIVVMGGTPGTLLSEHLLTTARAQRDLTWVFARTAAFMQAPDIQQAFALPAAS